MMETGGVNDVDMLTAGRPPLDALWRQRGPRLRLLLSGLKVMERAMLHHQWQTVKPCRPNV